MEKEITPYEQALALKELGFNIGCYERYYNQELEIDRGEWNGFDIEHIISAPTFSHAFRWFREKFDYHHTIQHNEKYVGIAYSSVVNFSIDEFNTYEEAELECLKKLIEMVKK